MSDEQNKKSDQATGWSMPEPVFRSSDGRAPGKRDIEDFQADIPTEPGFRDEDDDVVIDPAPASEVSPPAKPASGGCASAILSIVGALGLFIAVLFGVVLYFLYLWRPADTSF